MATYIERVLGPDETVKYNADLHWIVYAWPVVLTILSLGFLIPLTAFWLLWAWIERKTTDLVTTDKRVIAKSGWISRSVVEQRLAKVDAIKVHQSMIGRMFDYGTIYISGSGSSGAPIRNIARPLEFKQAVEAELERYEREGRARV